MQNIRLTDAGRAAIADGDNVGIAQVTITQFALGDGSGPGGAADDDRTALRSQRDINAVTGSAPADDQIAVRSDLIPSGSYAVTEAGLFARIGAGPEFLFGYWTAAGDPWFQVSPGVTAVAVAVLDVVNAAADVNVTVSTAITLQAPPAATTERDGIVRLATPEDLALHNERVLTGVTLHSAWIPVEGWPLGAAVVNPECLAHDVLTAGSHVFASDGLVDGSTTGGVGYAMAHAFGAGGARVADRDTRIYSDSPIAALHGYPGRLAWPRRTGGQTLLYRTLIGADSDSGVSLGIDVSAAEPVVALVSELGPTLGISGTEAGNWWLLGQGGDRLMGYSAAGALLASHDISANRGSGIAAIGGAAFIYVAGTDGLIRRYNGTTGAMHAHHQRIVSSSSTFGAVKGLAGARAGLFVVDEFGNVARIVKF